MSHHIIEVKDLHFQYPDGVAVMNGISFRIVRGESVGLIGANGAGKSTLLHLLTGILAVGSGEINIGGTILEKSTLGKIREHLGLVFQNPDDQLFMTTVYEDVAFGPRNTLLDEAAVERRVVEALDRVGILHLRDRSSHRLSGGEKRAAAIASILSMEPEILLMDEPTSLLDPFSRRRVIEILKGFPHSKIITSHDLDMVAELCSRVIVLKDGEVLADGPAIQVLSDGEIMNQAHLEVPLSLRRCLSCGGKLYKDR